MMMKRLRYATLIGLVLLLAAPVGAVDEDETYTPPADEQQIEFTTGYQGSSTKDSLKRVAEYEVVEPNPIAGLLWRTSPYEPTRFSLELDRLNSDQLSGAAELDLKRMVRVTATMDGMLHRLRHDPLTNLQAVSDIKVVRSTDLEPGANYQIRHRLYDVHADILPPDIRGLSFRVGYRQEQREGTEQVLSTSHCTSCHTVGQGREVDRASTDLMIGTHLRRGRVDLDYQLDTRSFEEQGGTPTAPYELAYRPATPGSAPDPNVLVSPFNDRLWFQAGDYPVNAIPQIKRAAHRFKLRTALDSAALNFTVAHSTTENRDTGLEYQFTAYRGSYSWVSKRNVRIKIDAQRDELDNDSFLVDLAALNSLSGPPISDGGPGYTGVTFEEWMNNTSRPGSSFNFSSYLRASALNRTDDRLGAEAYWKPWKDASLRVGYRYRALDRDNVVLADGSGKTTSHRLKLGWNQKLARKLRWNNTLTYEMTDNPYVNVDGGLRLFAGFRTSDGMVLGNSPSPKSPLSLQYFELHELRAANLGNRPTDELSFRSAASWSPKPRLALSASVRYRDAENDELDYSTWEQSSTGVGVNLWMAAGPRFQFTLGLDHQMQETDAIAVVPLMDG